MSLGGPYAIIRPTLVYGDGDLLLNNMAWALPRFPFSRSTRVANIRSDPSTWKTSLPRRWRMTMPKLWGASSTTAP